MRNPRLLLVPVAIASVALATMPAGAEAHDMRALPFSFTETHLTRLRVPGGSSIPEPSIELSAKDHVFFCGPKGFPGGQIGFVRTADWQTYQGFNLIDRTGGGDCDIEVGPDGAVYTANLQLWASAIRKSVDDGQSFDYQTTEDAVEQDRQWLAVDPVDGSVVYLAYHDWTIGAIVIAKSLDGAKTFPIHSLVSSDVLIHAQGVRGSIPGTLRVDPTDHERLYMVWSIPNVEDAAADAVACPTSPSPAETCLGTPHRTLVVGRSDDGGLTWVNRIAMSAPPGSRLGNLIPWLAVDNGGNVIVAAAGWFAAGDGSIENGLFMAASTDDAETWSPPAKVNAGAGAVVFPTVIAGSAGIADFAWLESTAMDSNESGTWTVRFAQSRDALAGTPTLAGTTPTFTEVAGPVVHVGDVCTQGLGCILTGGNRTLLDFIDMELDSFGYAHVAAYTSTFGGRVVWWRQDTGPSALSEPCATAGDADCVTVRPGPRP